MKQRRTDEEPDYPWHSSCEFELLVDGTRYFPRILQAIGESQDTIEIEMYLVISGKAMTRVIDGLVGAAGRGVAVRCLFDGTGSLECSKEDKDRLRKAGIELLHYNPVSWPPGLRNLRRNHRKQLIFDGRIVFVGGAGFTDEFCEPDDQTGETPWHEQMLVVSGPVVSDWRDLFERSWEQAKKPSPSPVRIVPRRSATTPWPPPGDNQGRVSYSDGPFHRDLLKSLLASIRRAESRVWIATPYFLPSRALRRALMRAAGRGVDVRLQLSGGVIDLPSIRYAGQRYYPSLLRAGVRILEYQPRFAHLKTVLVDQWVSLGSCNFDHWTLHWNKEANQNAIDGPLAEAVKESFEMDFSQSREWTLARWRELPWTHRLQIRVWGLVNRLVTMGLGIKR
jgi:cardiolipin synthase A/B